MKTIKDIPGIKYLEEKRTVTGYDIVEAVGAAFSIAKDDGKAGNKMEITNTILTALFEDDIYEKLHKKAKEDHKRAMSMANMIDGLLSTVLEKIKEDADE